MTTALMVQGTGSDVGKSLLVAGLCRLFTRNGHVVRPFKPQNMSNNAAVTVDGGEIGRAQALQARAAGVPPTVDMNPILLKPEGEARAQVIVRGRRDSTLSAQAYHDRKPGLLSVALESFRTMASGADLIIVEGAGSPAETNLRNGDIANMGFAVAADVPVVLVGDIHRGGVIASLVGTHAVLDATDRALIRGFVVNKFRGDPSLFDDGMATIADRTGWQPLGLVPHFDEASRLPAEDALALERPETTGTHDPVTFKVAVPRFPRIANFDDLDPLRLTPGVSVEIVDRGRVLPGDADLVILPGSKATISDLAAVRREGWDIDIAAHARRGGFILGLCGGYQMLGRSIADPDGVEGPAGTVPGLGLLDVETVLSGTKTLTTVAGTHIPDLATIRGYEMHMGRTTGPDCARPVFMIGDRKEGAIAPQGRVMGTYVHGVFADDGFRTGFLRRLGNCEFGASVAYDALIDTTLDKLADHLERHLDIPTLLALAQPVRAA